MFLIGKYILLENHMNFLEKNNLKIIKHVYFNSIINKENQIIFSVLPNCKIFAVNCQQKELINLIMSLTTNLDNIIQFLLEKEKYSEFLSIFETDLNINKYDFVNRNITNELRSNPTIHSFLKKHNFIF